ncbi:hypothetical protein CHELA40_13523 [Chelatococcus asaccharovorans]|nr:hypothetical protein CHELA40_13523 [Chelatococcus asaccharovorans]
MARPDRVRDIAGMDGDGPRLDEDGLAPLAEMHAEGVCAGHAMRGRQNRIGRNHNRRADAAARAEHHHARIGERPAASGRADHRVGGARDRGQSRREGDRQSRLRQHCSGQGRLEQGALRHPCGGDAAGGARLSLGAQLSLSAQLSLGARLSLGALLTLGARLKHAAAPSRRAHA